MNRIVFHILAIPSAENQTIKKGITLRFSQRCKLRCCQNPKMNRAFKRFISRFCAPHWLRCTFMVNLNRR